MIQERTATTKITFASFPSKGSASVAFGGNMLAGAPEKYNHDLARFCAQITMAGYDRFVPKGGKAGDEGITEALTKIGFGNIMVINSTGVNEEDLVCSCAQTEIGGEEWTVVLAEFLGTYTKQWYTNFDSGTGTTHKSFKLAERFAYGKLKEYIASLGVDKKRLKLIITGHSRGGAVANLLGAEIAVNGSLAYKKNTFTYTFAAPSPTSDPEKTAKKYAGIFNIVNEEDFVTRCMPREWGYGRYGITLALPSKNTDADYAATLERMRKFYADYSPAKNYVPFPQGDGNVNRLFDILAACVGNIDEFYNKKFTCFGRKISLQTYFTETLCAVTGEPAGSEKNKEGTMKLLKTSLLRTKSHVVFRATADFFVFLEGLAGATKGKISDTYFSYAHDMNTYCAYMMACGEEAMIKR